MKKRKAQQKNPSTPMTMPTTYADANAHPHSNADADADANRCIISFS
jgi:hypothetical protein